MRENTEIPPKYDFFLTYSSSDGDAAKELHRILSQNKSVFFAPESISPGDLWDDGIFEAQRASGVTVVLLSAESQKSVYVHNEINAALTLQGQGHHRLVPIYLDQSTINPHLGSLQSIFLSREGTIEGVARRLLGLPNGAPVRSPHPLAHYPLGPLVPAEYLSQALKNAYAKLFNAAQSPDVITAANRLRLEASPEDHKMTLLRLEDLPSPEFTSTTTYWNRAFDEARRKGPRMLAALVLAVDPEEHPEMPKRAVQEREAMLEKLQVIRDE